MGIRKARRVETGQSKNTCKNAITTTHILKHNEIDLASIAEKLNGIRNGVGFLCHCPSHDDGRRSLSLKLTEDGRLLVHCFAGCEFKDIIRELEAITGGAKSYRAPVKNVTKSSSRMEWLRDKIWGETIAVAPGDPVHAYLTKTRCLPLQRIPRDLRYHPALGYYEHDGKCSVKVGDYPAMVAAIRDTRGVLLSLHRTYLTPEGKKLSDVDKSRTTRKLMPGLDITGGAVHLGEPGEELVIAEGIETALAASILSGLPAWAAISASGLERAIIPKGVRKVSICVDNDEAGRKFSMRAAGKFMRSGKDAFFLKAPGEVSDIADLISGRVA